MHRKFGISTRIAAGVLAVAVLGSLHLTAADAVTSPAARAKASYEALNKYFDAGQNLLLEEYPNTHQNPYAYVWPYSQAAIAAENLAGIPGAGTNASKEADRRIAAYEPYWNAGTTPKGYDSYVRPPLGQGGDKFYDDNEWIGLHLIQHYKRTGDRAALARAKEIFDAGRVRLGHRPDAPVRRRRLLDAGAVEPGPQHGVERARCGARRAAVPAHQGPSRT